MAQALAVYSIGAGGLWETAASQVVLAVCKSMSWGFLLLFSSMECYILNKSLLFWGVVLIEGE